MSLVGALHIGLMALTLLAPLPPQAPPRPSESLGNRKSAPPPQQLSAPFRSGETFLYNISWRLIPAGEARMSIHRASSGSSASWQGSIHAASTGFVSLLYKVDDTLTSAFDDSTFCSQSLLKTLHEGRRHREIIIDFHRDRKVAALKESDPTKGRLLRQAENPIPDCVHDVVSALFYVRALPLEVGRSLQVQVNDGGETLPIIVEVQAKEDVKTDAGTFHAVRVEPKVFGGSLFRRSGRMLLWFTDDSQRALVQLKARLFFGTITASLRHAEYR